ncbi:MAG: ribonuclease HII [Alphaproteobacteria bacterium]
MTRKSLTFDRERELAGHANGYVAGVDEAGRGPWAGPVVAAAVILREENTPMGLRDSKQLTANAREALFDAINETASVGVGIVSVEQIDHMNILQATFLAMRQAVEALTTAPDLALVDGNRAPPLPCHAITVVGGDRLCPSIAAASIIAKVTRDRLMADLAENFPGYGWSANKGYGTRQHAEAIAQLGVTPHHRRSFAPIREALSSNCHT